ncbi:MAG: hypothetical protein LW717_01605 [Chloroflexaceae bacterium]|nr:hypothetical protein [Chloroflexaceae bacterium]
MSTHQKAWLALVSGAIIISTSPIVVKLTDIPGTSSAFYRVFIGCISASSQQVPFLPLTWSFGMKA